MQVYVPAFVSFLGKCNATFKLTMVRTCAPFAPPRVQLQVAVEGYTEWIQLVANLTIHSLTFWQWASSSVYYLLGGWLGVVFVT